MSSTKHAPNNNDHIGDGDGVGVGVCAPGSHAAPAAVPEGNPSAEESQLDAATLFQSVCSNLRDLENEARSDGANDASFYEEIESTLNEARIGYMDTLLREEGARIRYADALQGKKEATQTTGSEDDAAARNSASDLCSSSTEHPSVTDAIVISDELPADILQAPKVFLDEIQREVAMDSKQERLKAYADVYGQKPPEELLMDERVKALGLALDEIPPESKLSLLKAQSSFPWLSRSSHAKTFLRAADFDVEYAAKRMVRYWETRERLYGDDAFLPGIVGANTYESEDGYLASYRKSMSAIRDPNADRETKEIAKGYIHCWNEKLLEGLDQELNKIPFDEKAGFVEALRKMPELVASDEHRLRFLRSVDFQEECAARRMVKYWNLRVDTFGSDAFGDITIETLENEGADELANGYWCLLPGTDAYGRALLCFTPKRLSAGGYSPKALEKSMWYVTHAAIENEAVRRNGFVIVTNVKGIVPDDVKYSWAIASYMLLCLECAPASLRAFHTCHPPGDWYRKSVQAAIAGAMAKEMRKRRIIHIGGQEQVIAELEQCGISRHQIPVDLGGSFEYESACTWMDERRAAGL